MDHLFGFGYLSSGDVIFFKLDLASVATLDHTDWCVEVCLRPTVNYSTSCYGYGPCLVGVFIWGGCLFMLYLQSGSVACET